MGGTIRPDKTRFTFALWRSTASWIDQEAGRLGVSASDVVRAAVAHLRHQPERVREVVIRAAAQDQGQEEAMPGPRR